MATRQVEIKITGESGNYEATIQRITEKNNQFTRSAVQGAEQTTSAFGGLQRILINLPSLFSGIASGIAGAFGVGAVIGFTKQIINAAGEIDDLAKKTGFSRQTLSGLKSTIEENGGSLQAFATAMNKAQKSLGDIEGDGKKAAEALKAIGLNANELSKASPEQAFEKFAEALSKVESQNQRAAIATKYMGRAGADQIPVILELTDKFKKLRDEGANELTIKALDAVGDAFVRMKNKTVIAAQEGIVDILRFFGVVRDSARVAADVQSATQTAARVLNLATGKIEGMSSKEIIAAAEKVPEGIKRSAILARDALLNAREEFDRLMKSETDKPAIGGGSLPAVDEGAAKRQSDALEQAKTKLAQLKLANLEAADTTGRLTAEVRLLAVALIEQEYNAAITAAKGSKSYTAALGEVLLAEKEQKIAAFDQAAATKATTRYVEDYNIQLANTAEIEKQRAEGSELTLKFEQNKQQALITAIDLEKQIADLEADRLATLGRTQEAEAVRLQNQLNYLRALQEAEGIESKTAKLREAQIKNVLTQQQQLGVVTINVGQTIANSVGDAFEGVILGTRKLADVGKGLMTALLRDVGSFFTQALIKKLGFEQILLSNANSFLPQLTGLFSQGSGGGSGGGGVLGSLGKLAQTVGSLGGGFGGILGGLGGLLQGGTVASSFGFGSAGLGVAGPLMANGGFFSSIASSGGVLGSIFSGLSNAVTAVNSLITGSQLAATITTAATTIGSTVATTLTAVLDSVTALLANPVTWIAAIVVAVITAVYRIIANQQERPNAKFSGQFEGVSFDETMKQFVPGEINVAIGRKSGIKNSVAGQIADNLQTRLKVLANQWVDILNIFPDFIANDIQPALDETNRRLNKNFANLKFSPGGSRSIQQELEALSGPDGILRFFNAFQPSIEQGVRSSLNRAGVPFAATTGFQDIYPGFKFPQKDWDDFIGAIKDVAGLSGQLGTIGADKFLTPRDTAAIGSLFDQLFSTSDAATFTKAAAEIQEKLKPALDFLSQSMQESTDIFGRGLIAALDAATASDANHAFLENLGKGVKDKIFSGIVESFIASAQFGDLLAPIQQTIREFTQQAITTGETPDIAAFRRAIIPGIEEISTRATTLAPLIGALQDFGFTITDLLTRINLLPMPPVAETPAAPVAPTTNNVTINIENYTNEDDPATLARRIGELLGGRVAPPV